MKIGLFDHIEHGERPTAQLFDERLRDLIRGARYDDRIEGRVIRPALVAVTGEDPYVVVPKPL